jgi:DNA-binding transcriptional regulator YhcF (GntR family)
MGLAVTECAAEQCRTQRKTFFQQKFQSFLDEAARSGLSREEIQKIVESGKREAGS